MRVLMVLENTGRSFLRRLGTNLLLMCQFTISFYLLITMMTYYLDIGSSNQYNTVCRVNDRDWYELRMEADDSMSVFSEIALASDGLARISSLYGELQKAESFDLISARDWQSIYLETDLMDGRFGERQYDQLLHDNDGDLEPEQCYVEIKQGDKVLSLVAIQSVQMDRGAYQAFGLRTVEGEGFTRENTTLDSADAPIPVVLGYDYQGYFSVGEEIELMLPTIGTEEWNCRCIVVGILDEDSVMPVYGGGEGYPVSPTVNLDERVLVANGLSLRTLPVDSGQKARFASAIYGDALDSSYISPKGESYQRAVKEANTIAGKYGISLHFTSVSFGMEMLLDESQTTMTVLLILTGAMAAFTIFCLTSTCISRVRDNTGVYAIRLLNGAGLGSIIAPCLLEFVLLLLPALSVNYVLLYRNMARNRNFLPMAVVLLMGAGVFVLTAVITVRKVGGISIEEYMRRVEG